MKRAWMVVLVVALAVPAAAVAQEPVAAWCGGSYGANGTNFGECVKVDREVQVAGQGSGLKQQILSIPTQPEYPASMVTFEDGRAFFIAADRDGRPVKQELYYRWGAAPDRSGEFQSPGND